MNGNNSIYPEKFDMLNEDQKFINQILDKYGLEIKWLAKKIRMDYELLRYQLRNATNYRQDVHSRIIETLKKEGFLTNNKEICDKIKDDVIKFSAIMNGSISLITSNFRSKIADNVFDENEKEDIKKLIIQQKNRMNDELNDLLITIDLS